MTEVSSDWRVAFPDYDDSTLAIPATWRDVSWRNDACPSFIAAESHDSWRQPQTGFEARESGMDSLIVWIGYADADKRETDVRFVAYWQDAGMNELWPVYSGDSFEHLLIWINAERIALAFRNALNVEIGEQWEAMRAANVANVNGPCCASHDYCDANMPMADAFESVMGHPALGDDGMTDADLTLWGMAWAIAKPRYLTA